VQDPLGLQFALVGDALSATDDTYAHNDITSAHDLGLVLLTGTAPPMVYEPFSSTWSPLLPEPDAAITAAGYDASNHHWILASANGLVYAYDALTDTRIAEIMAPPGILGPPAIDNAAGRIAFPTSYGYMAMFNTTSLAQTVSSPYPIGGTPTRALLDAQYRRIFIADPNAEGTRVVDDTYFAGMAGDTLGNTGAPSDLAIHASSNRLLASFPDESLVRAYTLDTLQPASPPAVALSNPAQIAVHGESLAVLTTSGQLHLVDAETFSPTQTPLNVAATNGSLQILETTVPPVVLNEVQGSGPGWVELRTTGSGSINLGGWVLETTSGAFQIDLSSLGSTSNEAYTLICHPTAPVSVACDLETPALFIDAEAVLQLRNVGVVVDYLRSPAGSGIHARTHPAIDGRRVEGYANSQGTPGASNEDVNL